MRMIPQFSGPRMALLWHFVRSYQALLWLGASGALFLGFVVGATTPYAYGTSRLYVLAVPLTVITAALHRFGRQSDGLGIFQQLPITTSRFVLIESLFFLAAFSASGACYWLGYGIKGANFAPMGPDPIFMMASIGALVQSWFWSLRAPESSRVAFWRLAPYAMFPLLFVATREHGLARGIIGLSLWMPCVCIIFLSCGVSFRLARRTRLGEPGSVFGLMSANNSQITSGSIQHQQPFASPNSAQAWYELRSLWSKASKTPVIFAMFLAMLFTLPDSTHSRMPGPSATIDFLAALIPLLLHMRYWNTPNSLELQCPLSPWNRSLALLPVLCACALVAGLVFMSCAETFSYLNGGLFLSPFEAIVALSLALWSGWVGITLYPGILLASIALTFFPGLPPISTGAVGCLLSLFAYLFSGTERSDWNVPTARLLLVVTSIIAVLLASTLLPGIETRPALAWCFREVLGTALLLSMIYYSAGLGTVPTAKARQMAWALLAGIGVSLMAILMLQPTQPSVAGIAGICLSFGIVPPFFLPLLWLPTLEMERYLRAGSGKYSRGRRDG